MPETQHREPSLAPANRDTMGASLQSAKTALRERVRARLREMPASERVESSARARALLEAQAVWKAARTILFFASLPEEVDVWPLLEKALAAGRRVALPYSDAAGGSYSAREVRNLDEDLMTGRFGIREPKESCPSAVLESIDLVLVPGIAFDLEGHRLGRGKGFYDRLLSSVGGIFCGVAFEQQIVDELPHEKRDAAMNCIVTPARWLEPRPIR
jgi:5-formyltetrahydrofolate cyclo-ligase